MHDLEEELRVVLDQIELELEVLEAVLEVELLAQPLLCVARRMAGASRRGVGQ